MQVIEFGGRMLKAQLYEKGFIDRFLGLMADLYNLPITAAPSYSTDTIDRPEFMQAARDAIKNGAVYLHGVKTESQLLELTKGL